MTGIDHSHGNSTDRTATAPAATDDDVRGFGGLSGGVVCSVVAGPIAAAAFGLNLLPVGEEIPTNRLTPRATKPGGGTDGATAG